MAKRLYKTFWGIPNWAITGMALFLVISIIYDLVVGDRNFMRYILLGVSIAILVGSIILHFAPIGRITRQFKGQMGG